MTTLTGKTRFAGATIIGLLLCGCVAFGPNLEVKNLSGTAATVPAMKAPESGNRQTRVLVIHGMGGDRCPGYSAYRNRYSDKKTITGAMHDIAAGLDLCLLEDPWAGLSGDRQCDEERPATYPEEITLSKFEYARTTTDASCSGTPVLRSYEVYYTGALEGAEQAMIGRDEDVLGKQVFLNKMLKDDIVISGLGDAVAYLGDFGPVIRAVVQGTICQMMSDPNGALKDKTPEVDSAVSCNGIDARDEAAERNIYLLSHSLGSDIVVDTLFPADPIQQDTVEAWANEAFTGNLSAAYLLANQSALLNLTTNPVGGKTGFGYPSFAKLFHNRDTQGESAKDAPVVVGFTDRNDILSFAFAKDACGKNPGQCLNAVLNVARFGIPWVAVNPMTAHTGYWSDETVVDCIAKGCAGE